MQVGNLLDQIAPILVISALALAAAVALKGRREKQGSGEKPTAKQPLTEREQAMFFRLQETFPDLIVMPQVALSALLTAKSLGARNTFDRKVADFVLCNKGFKPICVIELDDASHRNKKGRDAERDAPLKAAGYTTLRFPNVPDLMPLRQAIKTLEETKPTRT